MGFSGIYPAPVAHSWDSKSKKYWEILGYEWDMKGIIIGYLLAAVQCNTVNDGIIILVQDILRRLASSNQPCQWKISRTKWRFLAGEIIYESINGGCSSTGGC